MEKTEVKKMVIERRGLLPAQTIPQDNLLRFHCYLCGRSKEDIEVDTDRNTTQHTLESEHVIPRVVFKPHSIDPPVILYACGKCNRAKGRDDEYITNHIAIGSFNSGTEERIERIRRSFDRPQAAGLRADFENRLRTSTVQISEGVYLGDVPTLEADTERLNTYLTNIAKGLWVWNTLRLKNWDDFKVSVLTEQTAISDNLMYEPAVARVIEARKCAEWWEGHFMYSGSYPDDPIEAERASVWYMHFYGSFTGLVIFAHKDGQLNKRPEPHRWEPLVIPRRKKKTPRQ